MINVKIKASLKNFCVYLDEILYILTVLIFYGKII